MKVSTIHESLVNGQRQQMVKQIQEYGLYDFFYDYEDYLQSLYEEPHSQYKYFTDACISYHRIIDR